MLVLEISLVNNIVAKNCTLIYLIIVFFKFLNVVLDNLVVDINFCLDMYKLLVKKSKLVHLNTLQLYFTMIF